MSKIKFGINNNAFCNFELFLLKISLFEKEKFKIILLKSSYSSTKISILIFFKFLITKYKFSKIQ